MIIPKRLGVLADPPSRLVLEYVDSDTGKLRRRTVYLPEIDEYKRQETPSSRFVQDICASILKNHARFFHKVSSDKVLDSRTFCVAERQS
jgi:hypothetical protein